QDLQIPYMLEYVLPNGSPRVSSKLEQTAVKQASLIVVPSRDTKNELVQLGIAGERIIAAPDVTDVRAGATSSADEILAIRSGFGWRAADRVIGYMGTFDSYEDAKLLIYLVTSVFGRMIEAWFVLVGAGKYSKLLNG